MLVCSLRKSGFCPYPLHAGHIGSMPETLADTASGQAGLDPAFHCSGRALYWTERLNPKKVGSLRLCL
jgi:hypothetical protein